jgi:hypothetical protein
MFRAWGSTHEQIEPHIGMSAHSSQQIQMLAVTDLWRRVPRR